MANAHTNVQEPYLGRMAPALLNLLPKEKVSSIHSLIELGVVIHTCIHVLYNVLAFKENCAK